MASTPQPAAKSFDLEPARIATLLRAPQGMSFAAFAANIAQNFAKIYRCLDALGMSSARNCIGVLATVRVECPTFQPVKEYGGADYHNRMYDTRTDLGNTSERDGDGAIYAGRGFIQITGKLNYAHYGKLLGVDLIDDPADPHDNADPDKALNPDTAACILAAYWHERKVYQACDAGDWRRVRKLVNGGTNGLGDFLEYVKILEVECGIRS